MTVPKHWTPCRLGDVLTLINGRAYKQEEMLTKGTPILRIQNLNGGNRWFYSDLSLPDEKYCQAGDLLYAWSATFGPYWWTGQKCIFHYHIWNVFPCDAISKQFAFYALDEITDEIKRAAHGVAMPHITKAGMENWRIFLPPLNEQKRIADKLDQTLAIVERAKARLARVPEILKQFRQSVLAAATDGRLTEDWRLETRAPQWVEKSVGDVCSQSFYGPRFGKDEYMEHGIPTIRTTDMTKDGRIVVNQDTPRVHVSEEKLENFRVKKNDLLITRTGSIGVMAVFEHDYPAIPSAYLIRFRFHQDVIFSKFMFYCLMSPFGQEALGLSSTAITQPNVNVESIKRIKVTLPTLSEQHEIIRRVETLFAVADRIEARYQTISEKVDKLTQSLLAKAFRGELVPQDLNDEPASVLLDRIRAQRASAPAPKRGRRKKEDEPA